MIDLTDGELDTLLFIEDFQRDAGFPPSYRDIANATDLSIGGVQHRVKLLKQKGLVSQDKKICRSLVITEIGKTYTYTMRESRCQSRNRKSLVKEFQSLRQSPLTKTI